MTAAAAPDVVASLRQVADELADTPRDEARDPEALIYAKSRAARRIRTLVDRIEIIEPVVAKRGAAPKLARIAPRPARTERRASGQMEMVL